MGGKKEVKVCDGQTTEILGGAECFVQLATGDFNTVCQLKCQN
jgi:hypothetical protein